MLGAGVGMVGNCGAGGLGVTILGGGIMGDPGDMGDAPQASGVAPAIMAAMATTTDVAARMSLRLGDRVKFAIRYCRSECAFDAGLG